MANKIFPNYRLLDFFRKRGIIRSLQKNIFPDPIPFKRKSGTSTNLFVTGIHRSGTSWVGDVLAKAPGILYWREPYNPSVVNAMRQQYLYLEPSSKDAFYSNFSDCLFKGKMVASKFDFTETPNWFLFFRHRHRHLIKDPTAAFMTNWLNKRYDLDILIIIRHPAAFVSSIIKLGWDFDFDWFLNQTVLMNKYLTPYIDLIIKHNYSGMDEKKGAILWGIIYSVLHQFIEENGYYWVLYETLCLDPVGEFKKIFSNFNLQWNDAVESALMRSAVSNTTFLKDTNTMLYRNTGKMKTIWKERLSKGQIELIMEYVSFFNLPYYKEEM